MPGLVLYGVLGAVCVGLLAVQAPAQITGSDLTTSAVNHVTGLKVKADGDPIGTIKAWPSSQAPDTKEWLECDGSTFDTTKYPELYAALGSGRLPDYKGQFLRGGDRTNVGKKFEDTIKTHEIVVPSHTHGFTLDVNGSIPTVKISGSTQVVKDIKTNSISDDDSASSVIGIPFYCCKHTSSDNKFTKTMCTAEDIIIACKNDALYHQYCGTSGVLNYYYDGVDTVSILYLDKNDECPSSTSINRVKIMGNIENGYIDVLYSSGQATASISGDIVSYNKISGFPFQCCKYTSIDNKYTETMCTANDIILACKNNALYDGVCGSSGSANIIYDENGSITLYSIFKGECSNSSPKLNVLGNILNGYVSAYYYDDENGKFKHSFISGDFGYTKSSNGIVSKEYVSLPNVVEWTEDLQDGTASGIINDSGEIIATYVGSEETAPKHTIVRYFIKAQ